MELTQLMQFKKVAECGNITHAAEQLYISQPALTKSIQKLEDELKVKLFDRTKNSVALNENGELVLKYTNYIFLNIEHLKTELSDKKMGMSTLNLASSEITFLRYVIPLFMSENPNISINQQFEEEETLTAHLLNHNYDIAVSGIPLIHEKIMSIPFYEERLMISVPLSNKLSKYDKLDLADLEGQNFIRSKQPHSLSSLAVRKMDDLKIKTTVHYQNDYGTYREMLDFTDYLTFSSTVTAKLRHYSNRKNVLINDNDLRLTYHFSCIEEEAQRVMFLIEWLQNNCERLMYYKKSDVL